MAGFEMPARGAGAAMLRDLRDEERPTTDTLPPVSTELRDSLLTQARTDASTDVSTQSRTGGLKEASPSASKPARKAASQQGGKSVSTDAHMDFIGVVDATLASREPLEGGVKATVDMSPELSSRAKRYLADHRGQSTRQVLIALFDAFLAEKGY